MRPAARVSFLAIFVLTAGACGCAARATAPAAPARAAAPVRAREWTVKGDWMATRDEAVNDALGKAAAKLAEQLKAQDPPMEWSPTPDYVKAHLLGDLRPEDAALDDAEWKGAAETAVNTRSAREAEKDFGEAVGKMRRVALRVVVSDGEFGKFKEEERAYQTKRREARAVSRQGVLGRVLVGLVALLAALACYLRLEDATKGYYTTLLRLVAVAFVALVGAGIWLLA